MYNLSDTIAAISTPHGTGGIAGIRISGSNSWEIIRKIFTRNVGAIHELPLQHMHACHGFIKDNEKLIDEVIILPYKSPNSFTGEDVIEIFCHGGIQIPSMILDLGLKSGARLAKNGEFTYRAFINGKVDLTEAEAVNEIISAETEKAVYAAGEVLRGTLKEKVKSFRERIFSLITSIEGAIEFPMDVSGLDRNEIANSLKNINLELLELIETSKEGQILRQGVKVSIVGSPNVGKSSLLNQLLENDRSIVTEIPGTTRDTIEEKIIIRDIPFVFIDTAGIRDHAYLDKPEALGIQRTKQALEKADIAVVVIDLSKEATYNLSLQNGKPKIIVGNKIDLVGALRETPLQECDITISAKYGTNIGDLKKLLVEKTKSISPVGASLALALPIYVNQRQKELLTQSCSHIDFVVGALRAMPITEDLIADELKKAVSKLDEISGQKINDQIIANIFSKFCIGK